MAKKRPVDPETKNRGKAEIDDEIRDTFKRLGIPVDEQNKITGVAVDAVFDSVSVATADEDCSADCVVLLSSDDRTIFFTR